MRDHPGEDAGMIVIVLAVDLSAPDLGKLRLHPVHGFLANRNRSTLVDRLHNITHALLLLWRDLIDGHALGLEIGQGTLRQRAGDTALLLLAFGGAFCQGFLLIGGKPIKQCLRVQN
jgi:hypothetical protein